MNPISQAVIDALEEVVGADGVITDPDRLLVYESDGLTAYRHAPGAVILPRTTDQARRVVGILAKARVAMVPRGSGTGLSGGALALGGAAIVATTRMNRILEIDPTNRMARVQPGVINAHLTRAAAPYGLYYAPDPSSQSACSIGGNVAENSGGPHCLKYGVTARYVTGLTLVLSTGEVVELRQDDDGPDLVGLYVGSEGCFGLTTEITVRLLPVTQGVRTLLALFDSLESAGSAVTEIMARGLLPAALEIVDQATIAAVEDSVFAAGFPRDAGAALVVEFDGLEAGLDEDCRVSRECCEQHGATDVRSAADDAEREALWRGRKKAFGAMGRIAPDLLVQDATVPRTQLPRVLVEIARIGAEYDLKIANVFHAGDGNLHPNILFNRRDPDELARVEAASTQIMRLCVDAGGTITGEHGVGLDKRKYMGLVHGPLELAAMRAVKEVFDPERLFNPGKVLPDPEPASLALAAGAVPASSSPSSAPPHDPAASTGAPPDNPVVPRDMSVGA